MNKKGQSLVEVVVALGILAMVFSGVVTLIVRVVDLELTSRDKTIAVTIAQRYLAETVSNIGDGCSGDTYTAPNGSVTEANKIFSYTGTINNVSYFGADSDKFQEILISVTWQNKGGAVETYELKQVVRK